MYLKCLKKWKQEEDGATAVEFALVAVPFMLFIIVIIELSVLFAAGSLLEGAVFDASRIIRTGQVADAADAEEAFTDALCEHATVLMNCNDFQYDVRVLDSFADAADDNPIVDDEGNLQGADFDTGDVSDIILVRVLYRYPMMTPLVGQFFGNYAGNRRLLIATSVFQSEPYDFED